VLTFTAVLLAAMVLVSIGQTRYSHLFTFWKASPVSKPQTAASGD
jgi:hypothetical protein